MNRLRRVMKHPINRRSILMATGAVIATAAAGTVSAQSTDSRGTVNFEGGKVIPEGHVEIYVEDPAIRDTMLNRATRTHLQSYGISKTIDFSFSQPAGLTASSPTLQIVARLERVDGWLLARGSSKFVPGSPIYITLNTVMY